ncbi:hypothetical protein GCM10009830_00950 [Glycomyces endophyticus]|uniref:Beta-lactamase-related domain-containing protein n=1 Tax=Glycomyces endophyticus TaxID=480996 RepID=A0ABN2FUF3_9ACTN
MSTSHQHQTLRAADDAARETAAPDRRPRLAQAIEELLDPGIIGITVRVNDLHGEWTGAAGVAEIGGVAGPPVEGHVRIGSNTKTFTAAMVLRLVAEGRIDLDAPVADHLPEFDLDPRITVRMLLQQTSGIFNFTGEVEEDGSYALGTTIPYGPNGDDWIERRFDTVQARDLVEFALAQPPRFEPGARWSYSNTNYVLTRLLVERVTGRTAGEELQRLILAPLGLAHTVIPSDAEIAEPHARAYFRHTTDDGTTIVDITRQDPSWVAAGGDMISTTADLHTFIAALTGGGLLPDELRREMFTPVDTGLPGMGYGLGVFVLTTADGTTVISHNGAAVGHAALMYATPDGSTTLTAALNCVDDASLTVAAAFAGAQQRLLGEVFGTETA